LASKAGSAGDVACWLLSYLATPAKADHLPLDFSNHRLRVNAGALIQGWRVYLENHRPPSPSKISRALKSLSSSRQKITVTNQGQKKRVDAYEIDPRLLRSVNEVQGLVDDFDEQFNLNKK
jgi:hypothetical protein